MSESVSDQQPDFKKSRRPKSLSERGAASLDRLPPNNLQMEMGVLGCIMLSPNECMMECHEKWKGQGKEVFYDLRHQTIYEHICAMYEKRQPIDLITLQARLKTANLLEQIGGIAYLSQIQDSVPSAANLGYYLVEVEEKYLLREMIQTCTGVVGRIYQYEGEVDQLLDEVEKEILRVNQRRTVMPLPDVKSLVNKSIVQIEQMFNRKGELVGIPSGFPDLDRLTGGFMPGDMIVIAARPSMGKTSLCMNIAEHVVIEAKAPVGVFSLEMSAESLMTRTLCSLARVNIRMIRDGFMNEADFPKLMTAAGKLSNSKLFIDATAGLSILQLRARARRMVVEHGIKLFVIDYLQLLHSSIKRREENRQQEIAEISSGIKEMAKELGVPVIVAAQLNREVEKTQRKPRMSDLRESGSIEQDADLVGLLYKPESEDDDDEAGTPAEELEGIPVNLLIAKQRNGPTGEVNLTFLKPYTRFESAAKFSNEDVPDGK